MTNPFLISLGALALALLIALIFVRRRRLRASAIAAQGAEGSMRETLARKIRDGEDFAL